MKQVLKRTDLNAEEKTVFLSVKSKFGAGANQASELAEQGSYESCKKVIFEGVKQLGECLSATRGDLCRQDCSLTD